MSIQMIFTQIMADLRQNQYVRQDSNKSIDYCFEHNLSEQWVKDNDWENVKLKDSEYISKRAEILTKN